MFSKWFHHTIGEDVPWWGHISESVIVNSDRSLLAMIRLRGIPWQTYDSDELARQEERLNLTFCQIAHESITLSVYQHRRAAPADIYPVSTLRSGFAADLSLRYKAHLLDGRLYENSLFLIVQVSPPTLFESKHKAQRIKRGAVENDEARLARLEATVALLMTELAAYHPRRLGTRIDNKLLFSEIAEAVHMLLTGVWMPKGITTGRLCDDLFDSHVHFGWDVIQFLMPGDERFAMMFGIQRPPASTHPLILSRLLSCSYEHTTRHTFRFLPTTKTLSGIWWKQFFQGKVGDPGGDQSGSLADLKRELADGRLVMGSYSGGVLVFAPTARSLRDISSITWNDLAVSGAKITREALALKPAFLSMIPGNTYLSPRPFNITSYNLTSLAPMHGFLTGPERSHWGGPIALFRTPAGTPAFFHWQVGNSGIGNTLITGDSGSGKTTTVAFLLTLTSGRAKIIALDHKRGWDFLIRALRGRYTVLGSGLPSFAPLKALEPTERNLAFLFELLRGCIGGQMAADEEARLSLALSIVMAHPPEDRSLDEIRQFLGVDREGAGARLEKWCRGRELGWVLDAERDAISLEEPLCGLDTTALLENDRAKGPALSYLFYRINLELDGRPTLIAIDEGWKALSDPTFGTMIGAQIRTIRSKNGVFAFITQGAEDITKSGLSSVLVQQCPTQIHLPSPRATEKDYIDGLKRTPGEFAALKELHEGSGMFLLCQGKESSVVQLSLQGMDDIIAILSARESAITAFDQEFARTGDATAALAAIQHTRALESVL